MDWKPFRDVGISGWQTVVAGSGRHVSTKNRLVDFHHTPLTALARKAGNQSYGMAGLQSQWPLAAEEEKTTLCSIPGSTVTTCVLLINFRIKASMPNFGHRESVNCFNVSGISRR